ncbi:methylmalonyl-CoA decarboxylase [Methylocella sp.]|uniref:methylmalonyl-CoA decarboxylase n=1 Tax=Methylocella sp. TaxID=1978226 RepID=UPI00378487E4
MDNGAVRPAAPEGQGGAGLLRVSFEDGVGVLTLDNPRRRNALCAGLLGEIVAALSSLEAKGARAAILRAAPAGGVWSAGHDVGELGPGLDMLGDDDPLPRALRAMRAAAFPILAQVRGSVWGAGLELALASDLVLADESASFAMTPAALGLPYHAAGLRHFVARLPVNRIKELFFTAEPIDAETALAWGLVNRLCAAAELEEKTLALARLIATRAPDAIALVKEELRLLVEEGAATEALAHVERRRRALLGGADYAEGLAAFRAKRRPRFGR